ncbi:NUMOD4 motif-containing HNH endonuclease [Klebsiella pneumoniae]|nr:NUMOD4 motif-containing HNH endonuclease [Klebsiella pneumoniae]MDS7714427.1 NUMOD4 motif-containing HNH endonuclease [Klebsiella pneumoniae]
MKNNYITWKDVVGYEGIYEVSNNGLVRTKEGKTTYSKRWNTYRVWEQRVLTQKIDKENSCRVNLWKDGKPRTFLVHRLVADAFIPKVEGKGFINHKDGSRLNNDVSNLEWCDHNENNNHAFDNKLITTAHEIKLINKETNEEFVFRSKSKASLFLNRNVGYISGLIKKNRYEADGYIIKILD